MSDGSLIQGLPQTCYYNGMDAMDDLALGFVIGLGIGLVAIIGAGVWAIAYLIRRWKKQRTQNGSGEP
jgi:hypothetical protein